MILPKESYLVPYPKRRISPYAVRPSAPRTTVGLFFLTNIAMIPDRRIWDDQSPV